MAWVRIDLPGASRARPHAPRYITATRRLTCSTTCKVVRNEEEAQPELGLKVAEEVYDLRLNRNVEGADRLVGDDEPGRDGERARNADALTLTSPENSCG